jgi:hypothetical protein
MIHPRDAAVANSTMMGAVRLVGLADGTHRVVRDVGADWDGRRRYGSRIRERRLYVTRQGEGGKGAVDGGNQFGAVAALGQKYNC